MAEAIDRDRAGSRKTDRVPAGAPIRKLLFIEALGHARVRFARFRPDHRLRVELATIDAHRAAEAAADLERWFDDGVARQARRDRFEIRDFTGRAAAGNSVPPRSVRWVRQVSHSMRTNGPACMRIAWRPPARKEKTMKVLLTGGSGNLGQTLVPLLLDKGDTPVILMFVLHEI